MRIPLWGKHDASEAAFPWRFPKKNCHHRGVSTCSGGVDSTKTLSRTAASIHSNDSAYRPSVVFSNYRSLGLRHRHLHPHAGSPPFSPIRLVIYPDTSTLSFSCFSPSIDAPLPLRGRECASSSLDVSNIQQVGGSKTAASIADAQGEIIGRGYAGSGNLAEVGPSWLRKIMMTDPRRSVRIDVLQGMGSSDEDCPSLMSFPGSDMPLKRR